jgi:hypothetical protein
MGFYQLALELDHHRQQLLWEINPHSTSQIGGTLLYQSLVEKKKKKNSLDSSNDATQKQKGPTLSV